MGSRSVFCKILVYCIAIVGAVLFCLLPCSKYPRIGCFTLLMEERIYMHMHKPVLGDCMWEPIALALYLWLWQHTNLGPSNNMHVFYSSSKLCLL